MTRFCFAVFALSLPFGLSAQTANPLSTESKMAYTNIRNNMAKMAEKMPAELYSYKPVPEIRTFGELVGHVADSTLRTCTTIAGATKQGTAAKMTAKAELVAALKEALASCDGVFESFTDAKAMETITVRNAQRTKLGAMVGNIAHLNEEYGYMAVYLRLKNIVPPSSEAR